MENRRSKRREVSRLNSLVTYAEAQGCRRQTLLAYFGDTLSHAVLPGVAAGFLWSETKDPVAILVGATLVGLLATVPSVFLGQAFFTAQWLTVSFGGHLIKLSTVLLFDIGVYLTVIGTLVIMFTALGETQLEED